MSRAPLLPPAPRGQLAEHLPERPTTSRATSRACGARPARSRRRASPPRVSRQTSRDEEPEHDRTMPEVDAPPGPSAEGQMTRRSTCAADGCDNAVVQNERGRPQIYCSPPCRPSSRATYQSRSSSSSTMSPRRTTPVPPDGIWQVRLRRRPKTSRSPTVSADPSAQRLASDRRAALNPTRRASTKTSREGRRELSDKQARRIADG